LPSIWESLALSTLLAALIGLPHMMLWPEAPLYVLLIPGSIVAYALGEAVSLSIWKSKHLAAT